MEPPSHAFAVRIGGVVSTKPFSKNHSLAALKTIAFTFMVAVISLERSQRCLLSNRNSSVWSLKIGNLSAKCTTLNFFTPISLPPGALLSSLTVPSTITEDSTSAFSAFLKSPSGTSPFTTVHCTIPVLSLTTTNAIPPLLLLL